MATKVKTPAASAATRPRPAPFPVSEQQCRSALDALPDAVMIFTAVRDAGGAVVDLEFRFVNAAGLRYHDRAAEEVAGERLLDLFPSVRGSEVWAACLAVLDSGESTRVDVPAFHDRGVHGNFALNVATFDGGLIVTARDVTGRLRAEEQLRHERDVVDAMLEVAGAIIVVTDADGRIVRFNRRTEVLTGYREADVLGEHYELIFPPDERAEVAEILAHVPADGQTSHVNHYVTKDGEVRLMRWTYAQLLGTDGSRTHLIGVGVDITDQHRAEQEVARRTAELEQANRDLERSNADLEHFAYIASHDLREPLRAISGPLTLVATRYKDRVLDETAAEFINYAVEGSQRMQSLIDGLLLYSRIGRVEGAGAISDADAIAHEAIANLSPVLESCHAMVVVEPLPAVRAEPELLAQVFQNLIGNAVKFVEPGVKPRIRVSAEQEAGGWRFYVTDNGIGIAQRDRERIFTMFKRLHAPDDYPGSGIGLAVVKRIVERHGGSLGVEDAPNGTGSRFWFTLPAAGG